MLETHLKFELNAVLKENFDHIFQKLCNDVNTCWKEEPKLQTPEISTAIQKFYDTMSSKIKEARSYANTTASIIIQNSIGLMKPGFEENQMFVHQSAETKDVGTDVPDFLFAAFPKLFADFPLPREKINWMILPKKRSGNFYLKKALFYL